MIAFSCMALIFIAIWMVWQFLLFLYEFKFIREIVEETKLANKIYPEEDNLKVELDKEYQRDEILSRSQEEISSQGDRRIEEETIDGIEKQYNDEIVHYDDKSENLLMESKMFLGPNKKSNIAKNQKKKGDFEKLES